MAYNDLSESKMTTSTPYGPCRGADFYKNDTLSRSRNPENDTLFSGTSPYRKIYKCPPPGVPIKCNPNYASLTCFPLTDLNLLYNCTMVTAQYQVCLTPEVLQIDFPHRSTRNSHLRGRFRQFRYKRRESLQSFASTTWVTLDRDGSETGHVSTGMELLLHGMRHVSSDASIGSCVMAKIIDDI